MRDSKVISTNQSSGIMSKATKRKHVTKEVLEEYYVPEDGEEVVKIIAGRGNNLHEVETASGSQYLASMPTKFRKNVWVKRGDFVVVAPIKEGKKVQGEIVYILYQKQIKYLREEKLWPKEFDEPMAREENKLVGNKEHVEPSYESYDESEKSESSDDELFQNPNHRPVIYQEDDETESSEEEEDKEDRKNSEINEEAK